MTYLGCCLGILIFPILAFLLFRDGTKERVMLPADVHDIVAWLRDDSPPHEAADRILQGWWGFVVRNVLGRHSLDPAVVELLLASRGAVADLLERWSWWDEVRPALAISKILHGTILGHDMVFVTSKFDTIGMSIFPGEISGYADGFKHVSVPHGGLVIDIGGHIGHTAILMAKMYPGARVISWEPTPPNRFYFDLNIIVNNISRSSPGLELRSEAMTEDQAETIAITYNMYESSAAGVFPNFREGLPHTYEKAYPARTTTLNKVLADFGSDEKIHILKMDCEGCEVKMSNALSNDTLDRFGYVFGEVHPSFNVFFSEAEVLHMKAMMCARGWTMSGLICS
eukprot:gnl/TRDRNA2_/TRDRNA2_200498_c0_seq1.p1 gnl/TRDRNA2_/TRDRNA2_200498_c0~~gnl/TRDRNA2_/TRDRNA2_200498_c0_seq1.p1  ORF type:complete len:341 (+),score=32.78 gnl/TRDRNA2_/TRDRNA2_200498_c0_seq1:45-1067(+)